MERSTRENVLRQLQRLGRARGTELAARLGLSRQAINRHLKALILDGLVIKSGVTRGAMYAPCGRAGGGAARSQPDRGLRRLQRECNLRGLTEDAVFREFGEMLALERRLSPAALAIVRYAFTEILNNAIDHSASARGRVEVAVEPYACRFRIRDFGVGVFHSIRAKRGLPDEAAALGDLLKGKTTTMPERHSGEGLFFTSRLADQLRIRSHRLILAFDNVRRDAWVEDARFLSGTEVGFSLARQTRRDLAAVFRSYAPEEYEHQFQRTHVLVRLLLPEYVARSEAKRMLSGLERFRDVVLDFDGVRRIGQGFADELFRVFPRTHPGVKVRAENAAPAIAQMIHHVVDNPNE